MQFWIWILGTVDRTYKTEREQLESSKLDDLKQSLSSVNNTVLNQQHQQNASQPQNAGGYTQEHVVTRRVETRKYETNYQQQQQQQQEQQMSTSMLVSVAALQNVENQGIYKSKVGFIFYEKVTGPLDDSLKNWCLCRTRCWSQKHKP